MVLEEVFEHMVKEYSEKNNLTLDEAIQKFVEITNSSLLLRTLSFGKLRGETFENIRLKDFSYLEWLGKLDDKDEDFKYTVNYYLKKGLPTQDESVPF